MADDNGKGAVRIITDLRAPALKPKEHVVWSPELYRETLLLADAQLELARMLDELDAKINAHDQGVKTYATAVTEAIQALQIRCAQLEARTLAGRFRRAKAMAIRVVASLEARIVSAVIVLDGEKPAPPPPPEFIP
jgi:hypothetical protein